METQVLKVKDNSLAPKSWDNYIGQNVVKERLQVQINAALNRFENLKHTLILGPPGYGKTTLAELIAQEMKQDLLLMMMTPAFNTNKLNKKIATFEGGIIVLDELHNLPKKGQHYLFDVMEKNRLTYDSGKTEYLEHPITFIGATTEQDKILAPLFSRFTYKHFLQEYSDVEMAMIIERMCHRVDIIPTKEFCLGLGAASAGTPRQARALVFAAQDLETLDVETVLTFCGVTPEGLTEDHMAYLDALKNLGGDQRGVGIDNIVNLSQRPKGIIEDVEKLLLKRNYIEIAKGGRELTVGGNNVIKKNRMEMS